MTTLARRRSNPVSELLSWLDTDVPFAFRTDGTAVMRIEDYLQDGTYVVRAEVPGLDPEKDLSVTLAGSILTIKGERHEEEQDKRHHEIAYGEFARSVRLPEHSRTDEVTATCIDGVLEVRVPIEPDTADVRTVAIERKAG